MGRDQVGGGRQVLGRRQGGAGIDDIAGELRQFGHQPREHLRELRRRGSARHHS